MRRHAEQYRLLVRKSINQADLKKYVRRVLKVEEGKETSTRMENTIKDIIGRCESGKGNDLPSVRGTLWTAYNGLNEWLSYERGHNQQNRLNSLWFGEVRQPESFRPGNGPGNGKLILLRVAPGLARMLKPGVFFSRNQP